MNFKSIIVLGLSVATLGLSVPAHADETATVVDSQQNAVITGDGNTTRQTNTTNVKIVNLVVALLVQLGRV